MLTPTLLAQGYQVTISESLVYGALPVLGFSRFQNLQIITRKVRDRTELAKAIEDHDWVLHLAVVVGYSACAANPQLSVSTNVDGTRNVPDSMGKGQRLIFASTGSTYEKVEWVATEDIPIAPLTLYRKSERDAERLIRDANRGHVILRFATLFGSSLRMRINLLINDFVHQALYVRQIVLIRRLHSQYFSPQQRRSDCLPVRRGPIRPDVRQCVQRR